MRNFTVLILSFFISIVLFAQQEPQFSQYNRNQYLVNPAAAGAYNFADITLGGRIQWAGFQNAPMTTYLYGSTSLPQKDKARYYPRKRTVRGPIRQPKRDVGQIKHAFGGYLFADQYGAFKQIRLSGTYAIHIPLSKRLNLSFGIDLGFSNRQFLKDRAQTLNVLTGIGTDNTYDQYSSTVNDYVMDIGSGLYLYSEDFYFGVSADQLTGDLVHFGTGLVNFDPKIHYRAVAGYNFLLENDITITPNVLVKYVMYAPISIEGGIQLEIKERLWFAGAYRSSGTIIGMVGYNINRLFKIAYSFDFSTSEIQSYNIGGHELVLGVMLGR